MEEVESYRYLVSAATGKIRELDTENDVVPIDATIPPSKMRMVKMLEQLAGF